MTKVIIRRESKYLKDRNPYFVTNASFGRPADTLILYVVKTKTGQWSKKWMVLRFNEERPVPTTVKMNKINMYYDDFTAKLNKLKKGYKIGEVILYSGTLGNKQAFD